MCNLLLEIRYERLKNAVDSCFQLNNYLSQALKRTGRSSHLKSSSPICGIILSSHQVLGLKLHVIVSF